MGKKKYYVVWKGRRPGIYEDWERCQEQVKGYPGARFKSYPTKEEALRALEEGSNWEFPSGSDHHYEEDSISVDVGTRGNPGLVEYRGVDTKTGKVLFSYGPIEKGTNNLGEFLAIVHALQYLKKLNSKKTVYSDSQTAIKWVRDKKVATDLPRDASTEEIWRLVERAEKWLRENGYENKVLKWDTEHWGEIKADYGRKSDR